MILIGRSDGMIVLTNFNVGVLSDKTLSFLIRPCGNVTAPRDGGMGCLRFALRNGTSRAAVGLARFGRGYIYGLTIALLFLDFISNSLRGEPP